VLPVCTHNCTHNRQDRSHGFVGPYTTSHFRPQLVVNRRLESAQVPQTIQYSSKKYYVLTLSAIQAYHLRLIEIATRVCA
jgi:hypothetical protein